MQKERIKYFDLLRIICAFGVVMGHVCDDPWSNTNPGSTTWCVFTAFLSLCYCTVPVFVMISGALFLDPGKRLDIKLIYKKYILRMAVVFFFWSVLYAIADRPSSVREFVGLLVTGKYHMWFILMLIGCYIVLPLLRKIAEDEKLIRYFLAVGFFFLIIVGYTLPAISGAPLGIVSLGAEQADKFFSAFSVGMVFGYPFYMLLGYYLCKKDISKKTACSLIGAGLAGYIVMVVAVIYISRATGSPYNQFFKKFSLPVCLMAIGLFVAGKQILSKIPLKGKVAGIISALSKYTFGVYLVHVFVLDFVEKQMGITAQSFNPVIAIPGVTLLVYAGSFVVSALLNKIPYVNKYIV